MKKFIRIDNPTSKDNDLIQNELKSGKEVILQFASRTYTDEVLANINMLCRECDENLCIRFYSHHSKLFDCKTLLKIPDVQCLYIDCLHDVLNLDFLKELTQLKILGLGVFEMRDTEILNSENLKNLTGLFISDTRSKAFNLDYLRKLRKLKSLRIAGHTKNIDAIGELAELNDLSLNAVKKVPVGFVNRLKDLKSLSFILGSRENLNEIEENTIENLDIIRVRGFNDLSCLYRFPKLQKLKVEDQIQLSEIHFENKFPLLTDLRILNCKSLATLNGMNNLSNLESLVVYQTNVDFDKFIEQKFSEYLKTFGFYTAKAKADKVIKEILETKGYCCR
jgi:protein phosphatase 1 regulatory subunit 7